MLEIGLNIFFPLQIIEYTVVHPGFFSAESKQKMKIVKLIGQY